MSDILLQQPNAKAPGPDHSCLIWHVGPVVCIHVNVNTTTWSKRRPHKVTARECGNLARSLWTC